MATPYGRHDFFYSMKNIPLPSRKEYLKQLTFSTEKFISNLRWRAHFFLKPTERPSKETYGFKSIKKAPQIKELDELEKRLKSMIRNIEFKPYSSPFQNNLKRDIQNINNTNEVIVPADKTSNHYGLKAEEYEELLQKNIQKDYKKIEINEIVSDVRKQQGIVEKLNIHDRVMYVPPQKCFVSLKDHKENFVNDPKCRLLNPTKIEMAKVSKQILTRVVEQLRTKTKFNLWKNTDSVIEWFENLNNKKRLRFISFDIVDYYGSISKELFEEAIEWAKTLVPISSDEEEIILESKTSLLYDGREFWKKKGDNNFDIMMGAWDSAESTDIVGLFLLNKIRKIRVSNQGVIVGLYRDDGLLVCRMTARNTDIFKKKLQELFGYYGLRLQIDCNHKQVNFLDIHLNFKTGKYHPYMKPNNTIKYINTQSNHPPSTIINTVKNISNKSKKLCK